MKKYKTGMYGGKFMPFHRGHLHCLQVAAAECDTVYLILFYNGNQEEDILAIDNREFLTVESRKEKVLEVASQYDNVVPVFIDVGDCRYEDGTEDWDAETPLVLMAAGHLDAVYGSEPSYAPYFERAYPGAIYRCLDPERKEFNISATMIRNDENKYKEWIV